MKITLFIGSLSAGGAERQLIEIAKGLYKRGHTVKIVTIYSGGTLSEMLKNDPSIELASIWAIRSNFFLIRLMQLVSAPFFFLKHISSSECIYSMLATTNFIAWITTRFKRVKLIWGIRSSNIEGKRKIVFFDKLCVLVSPTVELIISNSYSGSESMKQRGYSSLKHTVIPNGIDTKKFKPNKSSRLEIRNEIGISNSQVLIGTVGRLDAMKGYNILLEAMALLIPKHNNVKLLCVGTGTDIYTKVLRELSHSLGLSDYVIWLGERNDVENIYNAMDLFVSPSLGEGFSNVIVEAMASGLPSVVTNVGDSLHIVSDCGLVVEPGNANALAEALAEALSIAFGSYEGEIKSKSRERVTHNFSLERMIDATEINIIDVCT